MSVIMRRARISVADEVWVVTALLHREHPEREDFTPAEIRSRAEREKIFGRVRPGIYLHATQHCVANKPPRPGRYRMLVSTARARRRLFRPGDPYHPDREGAKTLPQRSELPPKYQYLLDWYATEYTATRRGHESRDPILSLRGRGKEIWMDEEPDTYVRRLREGWL